MAIIITTFAIITFRKKIKSPNLKWFFKKCKRIITLHNIVTRCEPHTRQWHNTPEN